MQETINAFAQAAVDAVGPLIAFLTLCYSSFELSVRGFKTTRYVFGRIFYGSTVNIDDPKVINGLSSRLKKVRAVFSRPESTLDKLMSTTSCVGQIITRSIDPAGGKYYRIIVRPSSEMRKKHGYKPGELAVINGSDVTPYLEGTDYNIGEKSALLAVAAKAEAVYAARKATEDQEEKSRLQAERDRLDGVAPIPL